MKNTHKKFATLLKLGILLFGFPLLLYNCEQDELVEKSESNYLVQKVAFKEFKNNNELVKKVRFLEENIKNNTKNKAKNSKENTVINLNLKEAIYIENKKKKHHSYTFYIENDDDKYTIKNIILSQNKKESYEAFLATYQITEKDRTLISQGKTFNPKGKLSITPFNIANINLASRRSCEWKKVSVRREVACSIDGCWESEYTTWITVTEWKEVCSEVSEGSEDTEGSEGAGPGGGGASGGGSTIPVDTSISIPPIRPDDKGECPDGYVKNLATGECDPLCNGDKVYNTTTKECDCPEGKVEDASGRCIDDPCKALKNIVSPPPPNTTNPYITGENKNIRIAITNMKNNLGSNYEHGFAFYNRGNFPSYGPYAHHVKAKENQHVRFPSVSYQFGTMHTHPVNDEAIPMFSHDDIYSLLQARNTYVNSGSALLNSNNHAGNNLFVSVLVVQQAGEDKVYAIKIKNIAKLQTLEAIKNDREKWKDFKDLMSEEYTKGANGISGGATAYQKVFLNIIKDFNLGVDLYEMEQTGAGTPNVQENWKKLTLNTTSNTIDKTPCNN